MFKRNALLIIMITLFVGCFSSFALADDGIPNELLELAEKYEVNTEGRTILEIKTEISEKIEAEAITESGKADMSKDGIDSRQAKKVITDNNYNENAVSQVVVNPELLEIAAKAGIDTNGLTTLQIKEKIVAAMYAEYREKAKKYNIDTTNLSDEQIKEQVLTIENAAAIEKARNGGINTDGLTYSQVIEAVNARDREMAAKRQLEEAEALKESVEQAKIYGIDASGMTVAQIKEAVHEKMMELIESAKALGIDYEGLSYNELLDRVNLKKAETADNVTEK